MKRSTIITGSIFILVLALGGAYVKLFNGGHITYEKQTVEVEKLVTVDSLEKQIKDAQEAKSVSIRDAGEKARVEAETKMRDAIELEVRQAYRKDLEKKETELEKKTGF